MELSTLKHSINVTVLQRYYSWNLNVKTSVALKDKLTTVLLLDILGAQKICLNS